MDGNRGALAARSRRTTVQRLYYSAIGYFAVGAERYRLAVAAR
jgi:hypothetical protein